MKAIRKKPFAGSSSRGRENFAKGYSFEEQVAETYRLLRYNVEHGKLFSGRQVDLFLKAKFGDLTILRAVECKAGPVTVDHIDAFLLKLALVRLEFPAALGTIVSGAAFTESVNAHASKVGVQLTLFRDLSAQLLDGHAYAQNLVRDCTSSQRYPVDIFIEPWISHEPAGDEISASEMVDDWLSDSQWNQLTLLGDVGTGKSFLSKMVALRLAREFLLNPLEKPLPILIDLRNTDRQLRLEGLVLTHLASNGLDGVGFDVFRFLLARGQIVLLLDGFDEMASRVTPAVTAKNFHELARSVEGRAKVLLTCRTHYFRSRTEEEETVRGRGDSLETLTARELFWDLIARKGFRIAYLRPFTLSQVTEYVSRVMGDRAQTALGKIHRTYDLKGLSQTPMLLDMIVKSIDKIGTGKVTVAELYRVFTGAWIHRDQWREVLDPDVKMSFLIGLARSLWEEETTSLHFSRLGEYVKEEFASQIQDPLHFAEIDSEIRTASFLTRDSKGQYGFAHKSFAEFFLALHLASQLRAENFNCLNIRRLTPEVINFLCDLPCGENFESHLEGILTTAYKPRLSENALLCLYRLRLMELLSGEASWQDKTVQLPSPLKLDGAQLDQVNLEGASLANAELSGGSFCEAVLIRADLSGSRLEGCFLDRAVLKDSILRGAHLQRASFVNANLDSVDLDGADLEQANLTQAYLINAKLPTLNWSHVRWDGAVLPKGVIQKTLHDSSSALAGIRSNEELMGVWSRVERMYEDIVRASNLVAFTLGSDPQGLVSDIALRISQPRNVAKLMTLSDEEFRRWIRWCATDVVRGRHPGSIQVDLEDVELDEEREDLEKDQQGERAESYEADDLSDDASVTRDPLQRERIPSQQIGLSEDPLDVVERLVGDKGDRAFLSTLLGEAKSALKPELWTMLEQYYVLGFSLEEIGEAHNRIPSSAVSRLLQQALFMLRQHLAITKGRKGDDCDLAPDELPF